jgi:hypothetical protein
MIDESTCNIDELQALLYAMDKVYGIEYRLEHASRWEYNGNHWLTEDFKEAFSGFNESKWYETRLVRYSKYLPPAEKGQITLCVQEILKYRKQES